MRFQVVSILHPFQIERSCNTIDASNSKVVCFDLFTNCDDSRQKPEFFEMQKRKKKLYLKIAETCDDHCIRSTKAMKAKHILCQVSVLVLLLLLQLVLGDVLVLHVEDNDDVCLLPKDGGRCRALKPHFHFNSETKWTSFYFESETVEIRYFLFLNRIPLFYDFELYSCKIKAVLIQYKSQPIFSWK